MRPRTQTTPITALGARGGARKVCLHRSVHLIGKPGKRALADGEGEKILQWRTPVSLGRPSMSDVIGFSLTINFKWNRAADEMKTCLRSGVNAFATSELKPGYVTFRRVVHSRTERIYANDDLINIGPK